MRFSIRTLLIVLVVCAFAAAFVASEVHTRAVRDNENRQTIVAFMVCDHLLSNTNEWPSSGGALKPHFEARYKKTSPWSFDDLKDSILLDFKVDGPSLMGVAINPEKSKAFCAIQSKNGFNEFRNVDPNQIALNHFRNMISY